MPKLLNSKKLKEKKDILKMYKEKKIGSLELNNITKNILMPIDQSLNLKEPLNLLENTSSQLKLK
jgi:hypothetical protein